MKRPLVIRLIISCLFSLAIALWTVYLIGSVALEMPPWFVLILACLAVAVVLIGIIIGVWILHKKTNGEET